MGKYFDMLKKDVRFDEGLSACINCGTCTAICPAAEFYNYDPRIIVDTVQSRDDMAIESLLKSETIWYCGECMSCKTRCPRNNAPGLVIIALRSLSQDLGFFTESEKGRQQFAIKRTAGEWILKHGYCVHASEVKIDAHPEQGPVWDWIHNNAEEVYNRFGANYMQDGPGILRKISDESLQELKKIFDVTGGTARYNQIEKCSKAKADEMGLSFDETNDNEYFTHVYTSINKDHNQY